MRKFTEEEMDSRKIDIALKEYEQNMITYRYLADIPIKIVLVYAGVFSFFVKAYFEQNKLSSGSADWLLYTRWHNGHV